MIVLTEVQRDEILENLSAEQREVFLRYKKNDIESMFLNKIFKEDYEWEYVDFDQSPYYQNNAIPKEERLYCACGREVKYQYILRSKNTNCEIGLSLQHFAEHTNIPLPLAKKIAEGIGRIDRKMDELLIKIQKGEKFQKDISNFRIKYSYELNISKRLKDTMNAFCSVDLPLGRNDYSKIKKAMDEFEREIFINQRIKEAQIRKRQEQASKRPRSLADPQLHKDIILLLDKYYSKKDSFIDIRDIVTLLVNESDYKNEQLIGYVGPVMKKIAEKEYSRYLNEENLYIYKKLIDDAIK
jgi:hypothetical protein